MKNAATISSLVLTLLLSTACGGPTPDQELASVLPKDTVALVRHASIDQLVQDWREVAAGVGEDTQSITAEAYLQQLEDFMGGNTALIDRSRPFALAVSMPRGTPLKAVVLVPTTDATKYAASLPESIPVTGAPTGPVASGRYVVLTFGTKYEKASSPSALMKDLPAGHFVVRADAEQLVTGLGMSFGTGLSAFKAQMAHQLASGGSGLDGEAVAEGCVSVIRSVLESAKTLEITVDYRNDQLEAFATLAVKPGSELDGWGSDPVDLKSLTGRLSGKGSIEVLMAADWGKLWPRMGKIMESALDMYPQQMRELLRPLLADYEQIYRALGPTLAADGDVFGADGMKLMLHIAPPDAGALQRQFEALLGREALTKLGISIGPVKAAEAGGASIRDYEVQFDLDKITASFGAQVPQTERDSMAAALRSVFGSGHMPIRLATKGGRGVLAIGAQKDHAATLASLDGTAGTWSKQVQSALARVADCNPVLIERIDFGTLMSGFAQVAGKLGAPFSPVPAGMSADFVISAGVRGNEWRAGLSIDVAGFMKMVMAMMPR